MKSFFFYIGIISILLFEVNCSPDENPVSFSLDQISLLPSVIDECSGIEIDGTGKIWALNDKGGASSIYQFGESVDLLKTINIENTNNIDWEDIALDLSGNIYISDSGNNDNDRQDLRILTISASQIAQGDENVEAAIIPFQYEDQTAFPPPPDNLQFDSEAMVISQGTICLFSRERSLPFIGRTIYYTMELSASDGFARFHSSFDTDNTKSKGAITGASLSKDGSKLVLTSNRMCWIFSNFSGLNFFDGDVQEFSFDQNIEIEGVSFKDNCTIYLADERVSGAGGHLYSFDICQ